MKIKKFLWKKSPVTVELSYELNVETLQDRPLSQKKDLNLNELRPKMNHKVKFLKVKLKSLAEESRIIRKEELRSKRNNTLREQLYLHRIHDVRDESRATHIAYAYLRGKPISQVERHTEALWRSFIGHKIWNRVQAMITKYRDDKTSYPDPLEWRK